MEPRSVTPDVVPAVDQTWQRAETAADPGMLAALYVQHADELRRFLTGVLKDPELAGEVLQRAFAKAVDQSHAVQETSLKGWLFRVAYNEALLLRRKQSVHDRAARDLLGRRSADEPPEATLVRFETVEQVRAALDALPAEQREVVRLRIYEGRKFAEIAAAKGLPLGTVLTRMRLALNKLREKLKAEND